ncbi:MAG: SMC-Scp complex subunit ScpB [Candidatus Aenigmatarchaeota archaeon]|nr:SMC-Scp complex subunit ScpB [Candidatus Aenigmarchaeota archaeon]
MQQSKRALLEAALFMAAEPLSMRQLEKILRISPDKIQELLKEIAASFASDEHGINIIESSAGWQMRVKPQFAPQVRHLTPYHELSRGLLRVLAMVAYKQPITQSQIVRVIGNRTYEYVKQLEQRGLIRTVKTGRTKALVATKEFASYFGLESEEDIKKFFNQMIAAPEEQK